MFEVCPTCTDTSAQTAAPLADRGIDDRLVELHRRVVDEKNQRIRRNRQRITACTVVQAVV